MSFIAKLFQPKTKVHETVRLHVRKDGVIVIKPYPMAMISHVGW